VISQFEQEAAKAKGQLSLGLQGGGKMGQRDSANLAANPIKPQGLVTTAQAPGIIEAIECDFSTTPPSYQPKQHPIPQPVDVGEEPSSILQQGSTRSPPKT
jgi:hypothetical protein